MVFEQFGDAICYISKSLAVRLLPDYIFPDLLMVKVIHEGTNC